MIGRWRARLRRWRAVWNRSEWMWRLLSLPPAPDDGRPGLVMIQIDGFSHMELQRALKQHEMPFLARLLKREQYELRRMYSGLPSNTPAMQGELFYGIPGAVPAFGFYNHKCNRLCKMFESDAAREVEQTLEANGEALLKEGTSYSNIYTGGAAEARWCFSSLGWGNSTQAPGFFVMVLLAVLNAWSFARAFAFAVMELVLALWDAVRGIMRGEGFKHEFKFVAARVGLCIILREWVTAAVRMDVARGMPVIHVNFVGYDEQAHRRGPDSAFAHWVLKGIDDALKRIWNAAQSSRRREYEIWIYSDHGQVRSKPYRLAYGKSLRETVWELWHETPAPACDLRRDNATGETERVRLLGGRKLQKMFPVKNGSPSRLPDPDPLAYPIVSALGPVGLIYLGSEADAERRARLGQALVRGGGVPLVVEAGSDPLRGWSMDGEFLLPRDAETILGNHPYREQVLSDLRRIVHHENAGDLIAYGWKKGIDTPLTFALENGSHGGISPDECSAFVMMPRHMERELLGHGVPRPADLHRAALIAQGRLSAEARAPHVRASPPTGLRVMTYNVHSCVGMDQRHDPRRIVKVISHYLPDVVALQELETNLPRSAGENQARRIAELLQFEYRFHAVRERDDGQFGNAILSRYPMRLLRAGGLPGPGRRGGETRGALWVELDVEGARVQVLNTHLGLWPHERLLQARALRGDRWLGRRDPEIPLIVCGDFNCGPRSPAYRELARGLSDSQLQLRKHRPRNTWFTGFPMARLDHILVSEPLVTRQIQVPSFHLACVASDHFPLVADIEFGSAEASATPSMTVSDFVKVPQAAFHPSTPGEHDVA